MRGDRAWVGVSSPRVLVGVVAPWVCDSTPPALPLQRGGTRRPFLWSVPSFCQRISEHLQSRSRGNPVSFSSPREEKAKTLDPRLKMSRMTEGAKGKTKTLDPYRSPGSPIESGTSVGNDGLFPPLCKGRAGGVEPTVHRAQGFAGLATDSTSPHPSLQRRGTGARKEAVEIVNELVNTYRDDRQRQKAKTLDPYRSPGSPIKSGTSVGDDRRSKGKGKNPGFSLTPALSHREREKSVGNDRR